MTKESRRGFSLVEAFIMLAIVGTLFWGGRWLIVRHEETERRNAEQWQRAAQESWAGKCYDTSWLLATTAGSPDRAICSHRSHRMRVQVATNPSNEEAAALVFCECVRDQGGADLEKPAVQP